MFCNNQLQDKAGLKATYKETLEFEVITVSYLNYYEVYDNYKNRTTKKNKIKSAVT